MNILFDINHPAHVHLFKNAIQILQRKGHHVIVTSRDKDITLKLLDNYHIKHVLLSRAQKGLIRLGLELIWRQWKLLGLLLRNKVQICISVTGACNVHICKILNIPTLVFYDTEHADLQNKLTLPFVTEFISPEYFTERWGKKHKTYNGVHDLAYLHPHYFKASDKIYSLLGLKQKEPFVILRFVSWEAAHDIGHQGISTVLKRKIIELCSRYAKVFIAFEGKIDDEFEPYKFPIAPERMHDALAHALLYIGEGGSMATEAAVAGTPSLFISTLTAGVFDEYEKNYQLMFSFRPDQIDDILAKIQSLLTTKNIKDVWAKRKNKFISDKLDLTEYMVDKILSYQS
ncbi:MAG: DUF354 domain-containing protein [Candidatus Omnitrophica bacterium]|nr:DUF354 domain-containing protein [Candidatus Omnitrophota bacterium]